MLCSVCGEPLYPGEGVYLFEDPNDDEKEYIFCSLKCLEEYFGIEEWCVGQMKVKVFEESTSEHLEDAINNFLEKEEPMLIRKIKYQVTDIGAGLIFSALMVYEKYDKDELLQVRDQILNEINYGIKDDDNV